MLIKYTKKKYINSMLHNGRVRISTYWHLKSSEQDEIGDPEEGQAGFLFRNDTHEPWKINPKTLDAAAMSSQGKRRFSEVKILYPGEEAWIEGAGGFNTYMFSLTKADAPSKQLMTRLGYDSAVEVVDIDSFIRHTGSALHAHLIKECKIDELGASQCRCIYELVKYVESKRKVITPSTIALVHQNNSVSMDDFFTKTHFFSYQSEFRIAYFFRNPKTNKILSLDTFFPNLDPVIVGNGITPTISEAVRIIKDDEFE